MPSRVAAWVVGLGAIIAAAVALSVVVCRRAEQRPAVARGAGCGGWTAYALPTVRMVDVATRDEHDVWLLTERGVYHFDGCTWRAHRAFQDLASTIMEWETIVVDPDGAIVVSGQTPPGPEHTHGCYDGAACCSIERDPPRRVSYRFDGVYWRPIEGRVRGKPEVDVEAKVLGAERTVIATSGCAPTTPPDADPDDQTICHGAPMVFDDPAPLLFAIVRRERQVGVPDADGVVRGWGTVTSHELWRRDADAWSIVLAPTIHDDLVPEAVAALTPHERTERTLSFALRGPSVLAIRGRSTLQRPRSSQSWASAPDDVYIAKSKLRHFDGTRWTDIAIDDPIVNAVWGTARDDVWVGGASGIWHFDGARWRRVYDAASIDGLGGSGPHDVWAVGSHDAMPDVLHFDGARWTSYFGRLPRNQQFHLTGVTSTGHEAWVVGEWGTVLHFNGIWWIEHAKPTFGPLRAVAVDKDVVWVAGEGGGLYRFD